MLPVTWPQEPLVLVQLVQAQQQDAYKEQARKVCNHREDNHCLYNADHHNPGNDYLSCYSHYHSHDLPENHGYYRGHDHGHGI